MSTTIKLRRDTAANWTSNNPILNAGEIGLETDTNEIKIGDGATAWISLGYGPVIPDSAVAAQAFTAWTPALTQGGTNPTSTNNGSTYSQRGKWVSASVSLGVTSAGSAGNDIEISTLPVAAKYVGGGYGVIGNFVLVHSGSIYVGVVCTMSQTIVKLLASANTGGFLGNTNGPSFALANGDVFDMHLDYEAA